MTYQTTTTFYNELYNTKQTLFIANYAHINRDIALISGNAGAGKTTALRYYVENNRDTIFVTANSCTVSATAILGLICKQLGKQVPSGRAVLMELLVAHLNGTNKLVIIDEADHLSLNALQAIRNLNDEAHVGVVLSGNDKIYRQMLSGRRGYEFDQLRTRIIVRKKVYNDYTIEEMEAIFPHINKECLAFLLQLSCKESLRTANKLYSLATEYAAAKKQVLTLKHLKDAQNQFLGEVM